MLKILKRLLVIILFIVVAPFIIVIFALVILLYFVTLLFYPFYWIKTGKSLYEYQYGHLTDKEKWYQWILIK